VVPDAGVVDGGAGDVAAVPDLARVDGKVTAPDLGAPDSKPAAPCSTPAKGTADRALYSWLLACVRSSKPEATRRAAVDLFVARVEAAGGFPILTPGKAVFFYVRSAKYDAEDDKFTAEDYAPARRQAPISAAGAFNGWKAGQHPLKQEALGVFHAEVAVTATANRSPYKLVARDAAGKAVWFSDPLSRRFGFDTFGRYSLIRGGKDPTTGKAVGHLEWFRSVKATKLGSARHLYLYLPPGYDQQPGKRYPVLYMHDGNNLFDVAMVNANGTWDVDGTADKEIAAGRVAPFIVVGLPNNKDRMDEYTHVKDKIQLGTKTYTLGGKGADYLHFLVNDVKPLVDARLRTLTGRKHTAVLGSSLGGLISYYAGLQHPTVFRYVGGMSSTFGWGAFGLGNPTMESLYKAAKNLKARDQVYYLDSGDNPKNPKNPPTCPNTNVEAEDNYCETVSFKSMLVSRGIKTFPLDPNAALLKPANIDIYHYHQPDAPHSEAAWRARLFRPLRLFFRP